MNATIIIIDTYYMIKFKESIYQYYNITYNEFAKHIQFILPTNTVLNIKYTNKENIEVYKCHLETIGYNVVL